MSMRVCSQPGCGTLIPKPGRCPVHHKAADRKHWQKTRAYNTAGHRRRFRPGVLSRDPICVLCRERPSVVADHYPYGRDELIAMGKDPDDPQYGRGLCRECDKPQTASRQPGGWNLRD